MNNNKIQRLKNNKKAWGFFFQYHCFSGPEWISTPKFCRLPAVGGMNLHVFEHQQDLNIRHERTAVPLAEASLPHTNPGFHLRSTLCCSRHTWSRWSVTAHEAIMQSLLFHIAKTITTKPLKQWKLQRNSSNKKEVLFLHWMTLSRCSYQSRTAIWSWYRATKHLPKK